MELVADRDTIDPTMLEVHYEMIYTEISREEFGLELNRVKASLFDSTYAASILLYRCATCRLGLN